MKIFKLSKSEMQKIFARPGIFVMAFLFILIIAGSAFVYSVPNRSNGIVTIPGTTVGAIYTHFSSPANFESKSNYDAELASMNATITAYASTSSPIEDLRDALEAIDIKYTSYSLYINTARLDSEIDAIKHELKDTIIAFRDLYNQIYDEPYSKILISQQTHVNLIQFLELCENTIIDTDEADNTVILNNINALDFLNVIENRINQIEPFIVAESIINSLNTLYLIEANARLVTINNDIIAFNTANSASEEPEDLLNIKTLISNYKLTIAQFKEIALNSMYINAFSTYTNEQVRKFTGYETINKYQLQETLTKNIYLFQEEDFSYNYANAFNVDSPSNTSVNAFDFAYFTLELFSFVIIIYVVVLGAGMIAGEEANGTMKLLAMRPYKRYKIFFRQNGCGT